MADNTTAEQANATSINSVHPSSKASNRLAADLSPMAINPRRPNLPLPRELRDQIWFYLLDGSFTRISRSYGQVASRQNSNPNRTGPKSYHFHTVILAVNRKIHAETEEILYKRNTFVVVSYQWPSLGKEKDGSFWIPVVSNKHAAKMTFNSLRVHLTPDQTQLQTNVGVPVESYIILASDVNAFCASMHARERDPNGATVTTSTLPNTEPDLRMASVARGLRVTKHRESHVIQGSFDE